ncbi:MAG: tetratricopeptide repeat protein [Erythrobacter sp.]|nr:tetratricopeptide repeat protein [Erythrobacter sp.]
MSWATILAPAVLGFGLAAFVLKLPRSSWTLFAAALLFGLAGYATQGTPEQPAAPKPAQALDARSGEAMVEARKEFYDEGVLPSRYVVTADGFTRRGQYRDAIDFLRNAVAENPNDSQAWVAMANLLVEHANGTLSEAADFAYARARATDPDNAAADYFKGIALIRNSRFDQARELWAAALEAAPEDARYRADLAGRLAALDQAIARIEQERSAE